MFDIARELVDVECPSCTYTFDVQALDASCQVYRRCPCCRVMIHLVEPDGSVSGAIDSVDASLRALDDMLKDWDA